MNRMRVLRLAAAFCAVVVSLPAGSSLWATGGDMGVGTDPLTDGSEAHPWLIEDFADFQVFANEDNASIYWAAGVYTQLECNLDLDSALPGRQTYTTAVIAMNISDPFAGIFDGKGYVINNLTINTAGMEKDYLGLFGIINGATAEVRNLEINNIDIKASTISRSYSTGGICGENSSLILNCKVRGVVEGDDHVGLIAGSNAGQISNCIVEGIINGDDRSGGISGHNSGNIFRCCSNVNVFSKNRAGGISGWNAYGYIESCFSMGYIEAAWNLAGGITGQNLPDAYLLGYISTINDSYSLAIVVGGTAVGSIVGENRGMIYRSFGVGFVQGDDDVGGLVGRGEALNTINSFWDIEITGRSTSVGGEGKSTAEMQTLSTFTLAAWDFSDTDGDPADWWMRDGFGYPRLIWQEPVEGDFVGTYDVNQADFAVLAGAWQSSVGQPEYNPVCNLDDAGTSEGIIDLADLVIFCEHWLEN